MFNAEWYHKEISYPSINFDFQCMNTVLTLEVQKLYLVLGKALFHVAVLHSPDTNAMNSMWMFLYMG